MLPRAISKTVTQSLKIGPRGYGSAAAVPLTDPLEETSSKRQPRRLSGDVKVSKLENGLKVVSYDNGGAVSRLSIALNAGSRFESNSQQGITHVMKNAAFITNNERTDLRTVREMQQAGGILESSNSRELFTKNAVFLRTKLADVLENVAPGFTAPCFNPWDLNDVKNHCAAENATLQSNGTAVNLEMLHKAAYRSGLGNSLYCDNLKIGNFGTNQLEDFVNNNFVGERITVVGSDVDHDELLRYVRELFSNLPRGQQANANQQKYFGGEIHHHTCNGFAYASLVAEGAGLFHQDLPSLLVLQRILGSGTYMKWGSNTVSSRLNKAASSVTDGPNQTNALNLSYSDSGLFGFHVISDASQISSLLKSGISQMNAIGKGEVSAEDLERAKNQARGNVMMLAESNADLIDDVTKQVALRGSYTAPSEAVSSIDKVTVDSLTKVAKKVFSGKPSLAVTGDTSFAPYVDELF